MYICIVTIEGFIGDVIPATGVQQKQRVEWGHGLTAGLLLVRVAFPFFFYHCIIA